MKIRVTLKDPDTMHDAVVDAVLKHTKDTVSGVSAQEIRAIATERHCEVRSDITDKWMPDGEYLTVEFDTEAGTATVISAKEFK